MLTPQQIFDKVAKHLLIQNKRSTDTAGGLGNFCRYRSPDGLECAAGCLIPDEMYRPEMEGSSISAVIDEYPSLGKLFENRSMPLLRDLQTVHDSVITPTRDWPRRLKNVAEEYNLDDSIVDATLKERDAGASV